VAETVVKSMMKKRIHVVDSNVLIMGLTFKENCPDIRNTRVVDVIAELENYHVNVDVYDPWAEASEVKHEYGLDLVSKLEDGKYDAVILTVAHDQIKAMGAEQIRKLGKETSVLFDVKYVLDKECVDGRL